MLHNAERATMTTRPYTRREKQKLTPEILGRYHDLLMRNDVQGFEKLLAEYGPHISDAERHRQVERFKHYSAEILRRRWVPSRLQ
jgi:hypothetical protein